MKESIQRGRPILPHGVSTSFWFGLPALRFSEAEDAGQEIPGACRCGFELAWFERLPLPDRWRLRCPLRILLRREQALREA